MADTELLTETDGEGDDGLPASAPGIAPQSDRPLALPARVIRQQQADPQVEYVIDDEAGEGGEGGDALPARHEGRLSEHEAGEGTFVERQQQQRRQERPSPGKKYTPEDLRVMDPDQRMALWASLSREDKNANHTFRRYVDRDNRKRSEATTADLRGQVDVLTRQVHELSRIAPQIQQMDEQRQRDTLQAVNNAIAQTARDKNAVMTRVADAMTAGDKDALASALDDRDQLVIRGLQLQNQKTGFETALARRVADGGGNPQGADPRTQQTDPRRAAPANGAGPQAQQELVITPRGARLRDDFLAEHDWIDVRGGDPFSDAVIDIDRRLVAEGLDPNSQEYYDELRERAAEVMPQKFGSAAPAPRRANGRPQAQNGNGAPPRRQGPPLAPPNRGTGGAREVKVKVTPERTRALMEVGVVDQEGHILDKTKMQRYLRQFAEYDRQNSAA